MTTEALVLVDEETGRVRSGTAGALDAIGASPFQLRSETCRLQDVVKCFQRAGRRGGGGGAAQMAMYGGRQDTLDLTADGRARLTLSQLKQAMELASGWAVYGGETATMVGVDEEESNESDSDAIRSGSAHEDGKLGESDATEEGL